MNVPFKMSPYLVIPKAEKGVLCIIGVRTVADKTDPDMLVKYRG